MAAAVVPLTETLDQLADVIRSLADDDYASQPLGAGRGSIGAHVRHSLDHVRTLIAAADDGVVDYDHRERGTPIETDRTAALDAIAAMRRALQRLAIVELDRPMRLVALLAPHDPPVETPTSFGRELAFVLSHTIHHNALIAGIVHSLGGRTPEHFGFAPATVAYLETT